MKRRYIAGAAAFLLCIGFAVFYFLHDVQTFAQKEALPNDKIKPVDLNQIKLSNPIPKEDGMVFYEIFVRSFYDSNGDGIGDLKGVAQKLDYIKSLGVNGIWLMPIYPSPSYHGYDVTDYKGVNPQYGTLEDLRNLVSEAHKKGIKVILDFVPNHTSSQHPWFLDAEASKDGHYRDYYVWADKNTNLKEMNDNGNQAAWYTKGNGYYYANFWEEMPDLNYDNPKVREEIKSAAKFWMDNGIDGFRIDAASHIFPVRRTQDTLLWWQEFGDYVRSINKNVYLAGEVWTNDTAISKYFSVLNSCFDFPVADQIIKSVGAGNPALLAQVMDSAYSQYYNVNKDFVDAPFLTNHDQERAMSVLDSVDKMKSAAAVYLTLPGNPFIYYGEEIGMLGSKPDERIREPFKWYDTAGAGQTTWEESLLNSGKGSPSVESEDKDSSSLLYFYRDMIKFRLSNPILARGDIKIINNSSILAYSRTYNNESVIVIHNIKGEEVSASVTIPDNIKLNGKLIKGSGEVAASGNLISIKLKPYSFVIIN